MSEKQAAPAEDNPREGWERFQRLARALFRVDKRDVAKHEPKRRPAIEAKDSPTRS